MPLKRCTATEYKKRVCAAMNYISHNLDKELTLEEIAKEATFSPYHFHRIFKAVTGETITEFIKTAPPRKSCMHIKHEQHYRHYKSCA